MEILTAVGKRVVFKVNGKSSIQYLQICMGPNYFLHIKEKTFKIV